MKKYFKRGLKMKELENVMSKLEKVTKKKEQMDNQIKL